MPLRNREMETSSCISTGSESGACLVYNRRCRQDPADGDVRPPGNGQDYQFGFNSTR